MKNSEELIYAPVLIPTLNRYDHFVRCLESLEECTGAEKTDVYVALDYPPSDHYREGWKKIDSYLHEKENNNGFNHLIVYRRETNYFFSGKGNLATAIKDLPQSNDRYIISEDDNVFSPNFLEFINKGLEKFKDDDSILAICGYTHPYNVKFFNNNYFLQNVDFSAWGYGIWRNKARTYRSIINQSYFKKKMRKWENIRKLKRNGLNRLILAIRYAMLEENIPFTDNTLSVYMALEDMNVVMPRITKVRNTGWDGSGIHCDDGSLSAIHNEREIDTAKSFEYSGDGMAFYDENKKIFVSSSYARCSYVHFFWQLIKCCVKYFLRKIRIRG